MATKSSTTAADGAHKVTIPCDHVQNGDIVLLQGHPCRVSRIEPMHSRRRYRFFGTDLFTKKLRVGTSIPNENTGILVQSVLQPVIKTCIVLNINANASTITALSETGDLMNNVVLDTTNLWTQIQEAFQSVDKITRILVVEDQGRRLGVDVKEPHDTDGGGTLLHKAARSGDVSITQKVFKESNININTLDSAGRTALFDAVESGKEDVVRFLCESEIEIERISEVGETALEVAAKYPEIARTLIYLGASPKTSIDKNVLELISAAAEGRHKDLESLLDMGVPANGCDRLGFTALHAAAAFGHVEAARCLIEYGADVNARLAMGGDTILHSAIGEIGFCHQFYADAPRSTPQLDENQYNMVKLLLKCGATVNLRQLDGTSAWNLAVKQIRLYELSDPEKEILWGILHLFITQPPEEENIEKKEPCKLGLPYAEDAKVKACDEFNVFLQYHTPKSFIPDDAPLGSFIYGTAEDIPTATVAKFKKFIDEANADLGKKIWAKDVLRSLVKKGEIKLDVDLRDEEKFIDDSFHEFRGTARHARFRRPLFTPMSESTKKSFSLVIPYFDTEVLQNYLNPSSSTNKSYEAKHTLETIYCKGEKGANGFHVPCSLDQSYYLSLEDSTRRDKDQVVTKYANRRTLHAQPLIINKKHVSEDEHDSSDCSKKLLMVNQLWLWKIDSGAVITAFPYGKHNDGRPDLQTQISTSMGEKKPPSTIYSLIAQILDQTVLFLDAPNKAGLDEDVFDIFEQSIADWKHKETECYNAFYKAQKNINMTPKKKHAVEEDRIADITQEVNCLREVKDIRDELKMIGRVVQDQRDVIDKFHEFIPFENKMELSSVVGYLDFRINKIKILDRDALSVEDSLNHLLDLKQKQGSLNEARDTCRLANDADNRARASEKQNKLIFVFTFITVIYTPISFATSLLAVPSQDFPLNPTGSAIGWRWWQVLSAGCVIEVTTFIGIAIFWEVYGKYEIRNWEHLWIRAQLKYEGLTDWPEGWKMKLMGRHKEKDTEMNGTTEAGGNNVV